MRPFSVDVFDRAFVHKYNDMVSNAEYSFDYLAPLESYVTVKVSENVYIGDFIYISNGEYQFFGIVSGITRLAYSQMEIAYKPFETSFDTTVLFDTNLQGSPSTKSLEQTLADYIKAEFKNNSDAMQNISVLRNVTAVTSTMTWGFNLKSDKEGLHTTIVGLYNTLFVRAMQKYGVAVRTVPDLNARKIDIVIGTVQQNQKTIEADLPSVLSKQITVRATSASVNKLTVYNAENYSTNRKYYLYSNGTYGTDANPAPPLERVTPVINQNRAVEITPGSTWQETADAQAVDFFGSAKYNNLIELEVLLDDDLVDPQNIQIGQTVSVIHDGVAYTSILTGRQLRTTCKLIFGCIRLDLTSIIKGGLNG